METVLDADTPLDRYHPPSLYTYAFHDIYNAERKRKMTKIMTMVITMTMMRKENIVKRRVEDVKREEQKMIMAVISDRQITTETALQ